MAIDVQLTEGTCVGNWTLRDELGRGGQGVVWGARARSTKRHPPAALKACFAVDPTERARFEREISLLQKCAGAPHILRITDADPAWTEHITGVPAFAYYVSERCDGSLEQRAAKLGDAGVRLDLFREACNAVAFLHHLDEPIIHRDIKPSNFLLAQEPRRLVLADFGIARALTSDEGLTQIQEVVGTRYFRAPEVLACQSPTLQSDIYSLGRLLEWLLTGDVSHDAGTRPIPRGDRLSEDACDVLDGVVTKATQYLPAKRYATVRDLIAALPDLWLALRPRHGEQTVVAPSQPTAVQVYANAIELARNDDRSGWRQAEQILKQSFVRELFDWRGGNEHPSIANQADLVLWVAGVVARVMPRLAFALAGVTSQKPVFVDQRRALEQVLDVPGWNHGGVEAVASMPQAIGFVFHYLHGALACDADRPDLALTFATSPAYDVDENKQHTVWKHYQLAGRPKSLGSSRLGAELMCSLYTREPVLEKLFGTQRDYEIAFFGYSMLLSLLEMATGAHEIAALTEDILRGPHVLTVPPIFVNLDRDQIRAAARRTFGNASTVQAVVEATKTDRTSLVLAWPKWKRILRWQHGDSFAEELPLGELA